MKPPCMSALEQNALSLRTATLQTVSDWLGDKTTSSLSNPMLWPLFLGIRQRACLPRPNVSQLTVILTALDRLKQGGAFAFECTLDDRMLEIRSNGPGLLGHWAGKETFEALGLPTLLSRRPARRGWVGRIEELAIITHDRPGQLVNTLNCWARSLATHHRRYVSVVVYDDSEGTAATKVEAAVKDLRQSGFRTRYMGVETKRSVVETLSRRAADRVSRGDFLDSADTCHDLNGHSDSTLLARVLGDTDQNGV